MEYSTQQMNGPLPARMHIYNLMKEGKFGQAKRIGLSAVGWDSLEIEQWIAERLGQQT